MSNNAPTTPLPATDGMRFAIVTAQWNSKITHSLRDGAISVLLNAGVNRRDIDTYDVPGAIELTFAASQLIETSQYDAVIVFGCVVRGGTPHFDYVCESVTQGNTTTSCTTCRSI